MQDRELLFLITPSTANQLQQTHLSLTLVQLPLSSDAGQRPETQHKCVFNVISGHVTHSIDNLATLAKISLDSLITTLTRTKFSYNTNLPCAFKVPVFCVFCNSHRLT